MNIGIVGLGLIGGSVAKALRANTPDTVMGTDCVRSVIDKAKLLEAIDLELTEERIPVCDVLILALYPRDIIEWARAHIGRLKPGCLVMDCGGVKGVVCDALFPLFAQSGATFIGAHPMAGVERSGFDNARGSMFQDASIILTPPPGTGIELLSRVKKFWGAIGFTNVEITTPQEHDRRIAFTSQLAHVVSSAYIKSPTACMQHGFSAGSYKDMTRVARLNEKMWTELFLENAAPLSAEIGEIIRHLQEFRAAIDQNDAPALEQLLREGRECKENADKGDLRE